ncbi:hypothetical protein [Nonomuraea sp. NPDC050786]|uniref:hypothetical protein n=1 Tax=Nonomuraea sp. NPDC050786 TaxID=3154840 RepID=UPI003408EA43
MGPPLLISAVKSQIPIVGQVCRVATGTDRIEALTFASELLEFCGWLHQDIGDFTHAMMWTNKALDYAMELGDQRQISYILMRKSLIAIESGDHGHGLGLANAAMSRADALTPRLRAVVLRTRAIAHAHLGEAADSAADYETALIEATAGLTQDENDCAPYCTPAYVAMAGERDQACSVIEETIPRLQALRSSRVAGQLTTLLAHMRQWEADSRVKDLLTRLDITAESFSLPASEPRGDQ